MEKQKKISIDISWLSLFRVAAVALIIFGIFYFSQMLLWLFFALVISFLFNPLIDKLEEKKVSRSIASLLVYSVFIAFIVLLFFIMLPPLVTEIAELTSNVSLYMDDINKFLDSNLISSIDLNNVISTSQQQIFGFLGNVLSIASNLVGQLFAIITIFTLAIFLSIEKEFPLKFIKMFTFSNKTEKAVTSSFEESQRQVVGYFDAKIVASIFVGIATTIFCYVAGIEYGVTFGVIATILNIIPIIGPVISCLLIAFFALFNSWILALIVIVFCIVLQQIESNVLVPILTKKIIGIPTVLVLLAVLIGAKLGGVMGAIFIIPVVGIIYQFTSTYLEKQKQKVRSEEIE